ncbi:ribonuclease H-like domain-containing protein [Cladorrhinum sp. PSN259]|nr:ribonuclease H-like domain-containing protein [Cladorrhinum sp. PSN259]
MGKLSIRNDKEEYFPGRPDFGKLGNEVTLWANYFALNVNPSPNLCKYDVEITKVATPSRPRPTKSGDDGKKDDEVTGRRRTLVIAELLKQFNKVTIASEFKAHIISAEKLSLPDDKIKEVELKDNQNRVEQFKVKFIGPIPLDIGRLQAYLKNLEDKGNESVYPKHPDEVDALGVILGHSARSDSETAAVGRSRFFAYGKLIDAASNLPQDSLISILRGYVQSVRMATGRLLLQTNVTHGVFRKTPGLNQPAIKLDVLLRNQPEMRLRIIHKLLSKSRVSYKLAGVSFERTIAGLAIRRVGKEGEPMFRGTAKDFGQFGLPGTVKFLLRKPNTENPAPVGNLKYDTYVSVADYYKQRYNVNCDLSLPLINAGTLTNPVFIPAEFCELKPGQAVKAKLTPMESAAMIKFACRTPPENAISITTQARKVLKLDDPLLKRFGVSVGDTLITVKGRELGAPTLAYPRQKGNGVNKIEAKDGGWNLKDVKIMTPGRQIKSWTYLELGEGHQDPNWHNQLSLAAGKFVTFMGTMGLKIETKPKLQPTRYLDVRLNGAEARLRSIFGELSKMKTEFLVVFLPNKDASYYNMVKKLGDVEFGIHTQCVQAEMITREKGQVGYFANVALKVNLKFGGANHRLNNEHPLIKEGKTMVVGYDVTHPTNLASGAGENAPSLVALCASIDSALNQYPAVAWQNPPRVEVLDSKLVGHFKSRLKLWQKHNRNTLPDNILIFRDGVSEGQFSMVIEKELPHIRTACKETYTGGKQPKITIVVSVKRHQTRFYPTDPNHADHKSKSPKQGTVVDRGVTNARYWDFYLQAHASLQGTARPAHYTVLLDEIFRALYKNDAADQIQKLTHDMCYLYGRATKAVSICPPAYYADLVCTRARAHKDELFDDSSSMASSSIVSVGGRAVHPNLADTMYYI